MIGADVVDEIVARCAARGARVALRESSGRAIGAAEFAQQVQRLTRGLAAAGLVRGDTVLFAVRPSIEAIALILAILRLGGVLMAADLGMRDALFAARVALARPRWVVAESLVLALARWPMVRAVLRRRGVALPPLATLPNVRVVHVGRWLPGVPGGIGFAALQQSHVSPSAEAFASPPGNTPAFIVFTSGTTADPKAVVHTQASLGASVEILVGALALTDQDVVYSGDLHAIVPALLSGACAVIPHRRARNAEALVRDIERYKVSHVLGTPSDLAALIGTHRLPRHVKHVLLGSAPVDRQFLSRFKDVVAAGTDVWSVYAMSEMLPVARVSMDEKLTAHAVGDLVGRPFDGVHLRLAADGELIVRGPHLFRGYLGDDAHGVQEHATGDLAVLDTAGRLVLLGRKKDMIIRGHDNIYPALHEPVIAAVDGVRRCSLIGVYSDAHADERVVLVVEPEPGTDPSLLERRVRSAVREIDLAAQPDEIAYMNIPLSGRSRKADKRALLEALRARPC